MFRSFRWNKTKSFIVL